MKLVRLFSLVSIALLFFFNACTPQEEEDYIGLDTGSNTFVANFEGKAWSAARKEATIVDDYLTVYGEQSNGKLMSVRVKLYKYQPVDKTYILNNSSDHYISYDPSSRFDSLVYWSKNNPEIYGQSGDVVITKLDEQYNLVSGEFKTRVYNNHDANDFYYFTQGSFTDVPIVDSLTIAFTGGEIVNSGGGTGGGDTGGGDTGGGDTGGGNSSEDYVNFTVDGSGFLSDSEQVSVSGGFIDIDATEGDKAIKIKMLSTVQEGTYSLTQSPYIMIEYYEGEETYAYNQTGSMTISEKSSERITGSFTVTLTHTVDFAMTKTLTVGAFSVNMLQ